MSENSILITSATGNQGKGVVHNCLPLTGLKVYALVRDPASEASRSLQSAGANLIKGDLDDPDSIKSALETTNPTALFVNLPPGPGQKQLSQARNVIAAAKGTPSIKALIYSSAAGTGQHDSFPNFGPDHPMYEYWVVKHETENLVREAGFPTWTIIRLSIFLQLFVPPVSDRLFPELWGSTDGKRVFRTAFKPETRFDVVDGSDIGAVVAAALQKPEKFTKRVVELAVDAVTAGELAERIGRARSEHIEVVYESAGDLANRLGPMGPRLVAAQELFNDIGCGIDIARNREEFTLTSVEDFFSKAQV